MNTPPEDRQPILTYVGEYDDRAAAEAIRRELLREGQVFYVHNRVRDIELVAENVRALVPEARVAVAHGQMDESRLERVVQDFWEHEFDVLVCTTIVESGIDMPTVNTLVVDRSDLLGLAQLYQLRGRVGRRGPARVRVPVPPRRPRAQRGGVRAAQDHRRVHRPRLGLQDRHARPRDPRRRQPARRRAVGPHRRGRLRPLLPDGHRGGGRAEGRAGAGARRDHRSTCPSTPTCRATTSRATTCAWRRTAASPRSPIAVDVDDVRAEWEDRYGPPPPSAAIALLDVARLRAECVRLGIRSITVQRSTARIAGLELRESQKVRLRRLAPKAVAKDDNEIVVPLSVKPADVAADAGRAARRPRAAGGDRAVGSARASLRNAMSRSTLAAILAVVVSVVGDRRRDRRLQRRPMCRPRRCGSTATRCRRATLDSELGGFADSSFFAQSYAQAQPPVGFKVSDGAVSSLARRAVARVPDRDAAGEAGPRPRG